jgi:hypothetical protein
MIRVYLAVVSEEHSLAELEALIGYSSEGGGFSIGAPRRHAGLPAYEFSSWKYGFGLDSQSPAACAVDEFIHLLPEPLIDAVAALPSGVAVALRVVQEDLSTPQADLGIALDRDAVALLARIRAAIDIDQYG